MSAKLDLSNPAGIIIGEDTTIAFGAAILSHDPSGATQMTRIGSHCFIGAHSIVLAGVTIGDHCIVSAGSVVVGDVAPNTWVSGNPARLQEAGISTWRRGARIWFA
ncbi:MAG: acyltransferase [Caulobacteraceae bacterium]|nr:acyltransferase [Caulobacteraceae bacterium]